MSKVDLIERKEHYTASISVNMRQSAAKHMASCKKNLAHSANQS